jgi:hypothetical protein
MPAKEAGLKIVETLREIADAADASDAAEVSIFMEGCHLSLAYIWATAK